jgi:integrase
MCRARIASRPDFAGIVDAKGEARDCAQNNRSPRNFLQRLTLRHQPPAFATRRQGFAPQCLLGACYGLRQVLGVAGQNLACWARAVPLSIFCEKFQRWSFAMLGKITKATVERLQPGECLWDAGHREVVKGFGARRQGEGIFYYVRWRQSGRQRMKSIGRHGHLTPDTARAQAKARLGKAAIGVDPFAEESAPAPETFGNEAKRYLERKQPAMKPRAYREVERYLMNYAKPLHRSRLSEIDKRVIARLLDEIEEASGPCARNRLRSSLSAFFAWAITKDFLETNPVAGTGKADEGPSRSRVLSRAELVEVWGAACGAGDFGDIVRLLILTGQRREEIGSLRWSEIDFERGLIVLPPERTKNRRLHELPLSPQARAILEARAQRPRPSRAKPNDGLIFGCAAGFSGWSGAKGKLDAALRAPEWRLHDLRRTAATGMAELGTLPHIIEAVLNHVSGHKGGVAGIYNRARYEGEMREALIKWADYIEAITSRTSNVRQSA